MSLKKYLIMCFSVFVLWGNGAVCAEDIMLDKEVAQWRNELESGIDLWQPLISGVYDAIAFPWNAGGEQAEKRWRSIRSDLISGLQNNPDNAFVADIKLSIAMMDAEFMKDKTSAIQLLKSVRSTKSKATSVHGNFGAWKNLVDSCCRRSSKGYVVLPLDDILKKVRNNPVVKAQFMAVRHLREFPVLCSDIATVELAKVYMKKGMLEEATSLLENLVWEDFDVALRAVATDKKHSDNWYITQIKRPVALAVHNLMDVHEMQGKTNEAIAAGESFGLKLSNDGWYHKLINERLADIYLKQGQNTKAREQYKIALSGYMRILESIADLYRDKELSQYFLLPRKKKILALKKAINAAGGNVNIDSNELMSIIEQKEKEKPESILDSDEVKETFNKMYSGKGKYADPKERKKGASDLVKMVKEEAGKATKENREDIKKVRKSFALAFARMAFVEEDKDVRIAMVDSVNEIVQPQAEYKADPISTADKKKVDNLLAQIIGKDVEKPVPFPGTNLATMNASALLYAATQVQKGSLSLEGRCLAAKALANSESPVLYEFFDNLLRNAEDDELKEVAVRGLGRIVKNADINDDGMIMMSE